MPKTPSRFNAALEPIEDKLPADVAAAIGRIVARHSYLEWILGQVLYSLLEISIKQGRAVVQRPTPREYIAAVQGLHAFHKLESRFDFEKLAAALEAADAARDTLVGSVCMHDVDRKRSPIFLVRGSWARGLDLDTVSRDAWPEAPALDGKLLGKLRDDVEAAVDRAEKLRETTDRMLRKLHELRRKDPRLNRRQSR
jgi:hypothetical protein